MLRHLAGLFVVIVFFVGIMAIPSGADSASHALFVPYDGPYGQVLPPPRVLPEDHHALVDKYGRQWKAGHWKWLGQGYQWIPGYFYSVKRHVHRPVFQLQSNT